MKKQLLLLTLLCLSIFIPQAYAQEPIPQEEKQALVDLYKATNGPKWKTRVRWNLDDPVSKWKGVKITGGHVTMIDLHSVALVGDIPASIAHLTELKILYISNNQITKLPAELFSMKKVEQLFLNDQRTEEQSGVDRQYTLTGTLPKVIDMPALQVMEISDTGISGNLSEMKTPKLKYLQANNCNLESLHPSLWKCPNLMMVAIQLLPGRKEPLPLKGTLPTDFSTCTKLLALAIGGAPGFAGEISPSIALCTNMQQLLLQNAHTGSIPKEIGSMKKLILLSLAQNKLTGEIPESLGNLTSLQSLYLGKNQLTGKIPENLKNLSELKVFNLKGNKLSGSLPEWLGSMKKLIEITLGDNEFEGKIPEKWAPLPEDKKGEDEMGCPTLMRLDLANLKLSGGIPERFANFKKMDRIWLNNSGLSGDPTSVLSMMTELSQVYIQDNNFTGRIDGILSQTPLEELRVFYAQNNHFYGSVEEREYVGDSWGPYYRFNRGGINISHNDFVPKDFEKLAPVLLGEAPQNITDFCTYSPQNKIPVEKRNKKVKEGENISFEIPSLEPLRNNPFSATDTSTTPYVYTWYKDDATIEGETHPTLSLTKVTAEAAGIYVCKVTNARVPNLEIASQDMILSVDTGLLPIETNQNLVTREGEILAIDGATAIAIYSANGNLIRRCKDDKISTAGITSTSVIIIYEREGKATAIKYIL